MRVLLAVAMMSAISAPSFAQVDRGYVTGIGGFAVTPDTTSGDVLGEVGVRVAPRLFVFGNVGQFHNLQPSDAQPAIDSTTAMSAAEGLNVSGTGRVPAWYSTGGVRYEVPMSGRIAPYVIGGMGFARLTPKLQFTYSSGQLPDGSVPAVGADVTTQLVSAGDLTMLADSNAFMFTLGGGVQVPVAPRWTVDLGYRFSRVAADTPLNAQGATFGVAYRF